MRRLSSAAWLLVALALCGCLAGKRISDIDAPGSPAPAASGGFWALPAGVVVSSAKRRAALVDGLYPSIDAAERCCWIAPSATVVASKVGPANAAVVTILVPDYPFFEAHPQGLSIAVGGALQRFDGLSPGVHRLPVPLPPALRSGRGNVSFIFHTAETFVPADEHVNADRRALGLILLGIAFT